MSGPTLYTTSQSASNFRGNFASDPPTPSNGEFYYNTVSNVFKAYWNSTWITLTANEVAQIITNKDIDGGTASNSSRVTLPKNTTTNLNALTRKQATVLYDTTTNEVKFDNGTVLTALLSTSSVTVLTAPYDKLSYSLACSVAANALTIALKNAAGNDPTSGDPVKISFRDPTSATGTYAQVSSTAATSVVVSSGSTLGHLSAVSEDIFVYAINNAGTIELAVMTALILDEGSVQTSTAEGGAGAADSRTVLYSTTARSNKAIRLIARLKSTQATAGTWASVPTEIALNPTLPVLSRWNPFTMTITGSSVNPAKGGIALEKGYWRRDGPDMIIMWTFQQNTAGSAGTGTYIFNIPAGFAIDTNFIAANTDPNAAQHVGTGEINNGASKVFTCEMLAYSSVGLSCRWESTPGQWDTLVSSTSLALSSGNWQMSFLARTPISGW